MDFKDTFEQPDIFKYMSFEEFKENNSYSDNLIDGDPKNYPQLGCLFKYLVGLNGAFIAGGAIRDLLTGKTPRDIDVYFQDQRYYDLAKTYLNKKYKKVYNNNKVYCINVNGMNVELIHSIYGDPVDILTEFDFTIDKFALGNTISYDNDDPAQFCIFHKNYFEHLLTKRLVIDSYLPMPLGAYNRLFKYAKYGFFPCKSTKYIIAKFIQKSSFETPDDIVNGFYDGLD